MRPIDAGALLSKFEQSMKELVSSTTCHENIDLEALSLLCGTVLILNAPTVQTVPVVHGRWIDKPNPRWNAYDIRNCSVCGWNIHKSKLRVKDNWMYCPNCGALMDGKAE